MFSTSLAEISSALAALHVLKVYRHAASIRWYSLHRQLIMWLSYVDMVVKVLK